MAHEFGLPQASGTLPRLNATGAHGYVTADVRAELDRLTDLDREIYEDALRRYGARVPNVARHADGADLRALSLT